MSRGISQAEAEYILRGCGLGLRGDGRGAGDFRPVLVESDVFAHCAGSSRVSVGSAVDVICGVKVVVVEAVNDENQYCECSVEFSPSCNLKMDEKTAAKSSAHIADIIKASVINNCSEYFPNLIIIPGKFYWRIHIDLLILQTDGNSIDVCSFSVYNALKCTRIPKSEVFVGESGRPEDFEVSGEVTDAVLFEPSSLPICITVTKLAKSVLILDATSTEEACSQASVTIAVSQEKCDSVDIDHSSFKVCGLFKSGSGSFTPDELIVAVNHARLACAAIRPNLDEVYLSTLEEDRKFPDYPPSRVGLLA